MRLFSPSYALLSGRGSRCPSGRWGCWSDSRLSASDLIPTTDTLDPYTLLTTKYVDIPDVLSNLISPHARACYKIMHDPGTQQGPPIGSRDAQRFSEHFKENERYINCTNKNLGRSRRVRDLPVLLAPVFKYLHTFIYAKMACSTYSDPTLQCKIPLTLHTSLTLLIICHVA